MNSALGHAVNIGSVLLSILLLWKGADWLVEGASRIARRFNISELVIGLTLVAMGTSAPEFAVSINAALAGQSDISVGNIVGSNVFNLGFILGSCALIRPISTSRPLVYRDGGFLLLITLALLAFLYNLSLSRWEGAVLLALLVGYGILLWSRRTSLEEVEVPEEGAQNTSTAKDSAWVVVGLAMVVGGAELLVYGASGVARAFGMSDWAIGVTVVAAGTSAPEVVTSLTAALKDKHGISAGGLIGSDIFNVLGVLGLAACIRPLNMAPAGRESLILLVGMVALTVVFMRSGWRLSRTEGALLLVIAAIRWGADIMDVSLLS